MKTAISIPDSIFQEADTLAKRLGFSRSELYSKAIEAFLEEHRGDQIISALNKLYSQEHSELAPVLQQLQDLTFSDTSLEEW